VPSRHTIHTDPFLYSAWQWDPSATTLAIISLGGKMIVNSNDC
jgi:hypothetical protein